MTRRGKVPADPGEWSKQSQRSVSAEWTTEYRDKPYKCWHCGADAVFTAGDQKYTYEVRKAQIDQQRVLCQPCWRESLEIAADLEAHASKWAGEKGRLRSDKSFLKNWLSLLEKQEYYVRDKADTARKNMIRKLLSDV